MNGLALCAGAGGLELGIAIAESEYRCVAAIENEADAARILRKRHPSARIFRDVVGFDARRLDGCVDIVSAGFPCQPHSVAGQRKGTADERWIWPDIARIISECNPPVVFLENVAGLLRDADSDSDADGVDDEPADAMGGFGEVLRDLAGCRYVAQWLCLRASEVGASHHRKRVFILAYRHGAGCQQPDKWKLSPQDSGRLDDRPDGPCGAMGNASGGRQRIDGSASRLRQPDAILGYADIAGLEGRRERFSEYADQWIIRSAGHCFAPGPASEAWPAILAKRLDLAPALSPVEKAFAIAVQEGIDAAEAETESTLCRLADGVARWLVERRPRLQRCGNGVVPLQAAVAFAELTRRLQA